MRTFNRVIAGSATAVLLASGLAACGESEAPVDAIQVSGSATVAPITEAVANRGDFEVSVEAEGTTDGFQRFCTGETPLQNASISIPGEGQHTDFMSMCEENGVEYIEIPIGLDALSIIRNQDNRFAEDLTLDEIRRAWEPGSDVTTWSDLRPDWPDEEIGFYGRPDGSGTFEYFSHFVSGEAGELREGYQGTDDTDELANWLAEDEFGLGFMGVGNYLAADGEDRDQITNVQVDGVYPTLESAQEGEYTPFTRPLFLYVNAEMADDPAVSEFVDYYVDEVRHAIPTVFFYALSEEDSEIAAQRWHDRTTGTLFDGDPFTEESIEDVLAQN